MDSLGWNLKNDRMISVHSQGKPFNIWVIQVYNPPSNTEEAEVEQFYEELQDFQEQTPYSNNTREDSIHGHQQMVNTKIRLIIFFAAKDREALHGQQKQDWELTVAQTMNSLLQIQTQIEESRENH